MLMGELSPAAAALKGATANALHIWGLKVTWLTIPLLPTRKPEIRQQNSIITNKLLNL